VRCATALGEERPTVGGAMMEASMNYEIEVQEIKSRRRGLGRFAIGASMLFVLVLVFRQIL